MTLRTSITIPQAIPVAIAIISAAVLAYEVLLMQLFSIVQWHHFAYMAISIALLGFGASGTFLFLAQRWVRKLFIAAFTTSAAVFGVSALAAFVIAQRLPFNALAVVWEPQQLLYLLLFYVLFAVPFFAGATCVGMAFMCLSRSIGRIYAFNMVGSGLGALGLIGVLYFIAPEGALRLVANLGLVAAAVAALSLERHRGWFVGGVAAAVVAVLLVPSSWTDLRLSPYKGLSMALAVPGAEVIEERSSPLGLLTVVRSPKVPFRHAPGLSLHNTIEPPSQLGVFANGDGLTAITAFTGDLEPLAYLDFTTSALPYHLLDAPEVLILGAGGGADVLQALYHRAAKVDAVELDRRIVNLIKDGQRDFAGGLYDLPQVRAHVSEARQFVAGNSGAWDLIQIPLLDSFAAAASGVHGLSESYIYTVEAFQEYLGHLRPGGYLAITRWTKLPPRDSLKLFATAIKALQLTGVAEPARRLALVRGWNTVTLLVRGSAIGPIEAAVISAFAAERAFDPAYFPGMVAADANRANILQEPYFFDAAQALAGPGGDDFLARYKFDVRPATDDRPYFFDFFRWRSLPEFLKLRSQGGASLIEWGYPVLFATLAQAAVLSAALIVLPLWLRRHDGGNVAERRRVVVYFMCLGLAFLFVEIAFIQRFILFLGHPIYAVAVVLSGFLVFAGVGSGLSSTFAAHVMVGRLRGLTPIGVAVVSVAVIALLYVVVLPPIFARLIALPDAARIVLSLILIAPLAFFMGMPFPLGLARVSGRAPELVPWAWGVNGCFSVISAVLATILAIHFGFGVVVAIAAGLYLVAGFVFVDLK